MCSGTNLHEKPGDGPGRRAVQGAGRGTRCGGRRCPGQQPKRPEVGERGAACPGGFSFPTGSGTGRTKGGGLACLRLGLVPGPEGHDHCLVPGQPLQWTGGGHRPRRGLPRVQRSRLELGLTPSLLPPCLARVPGPQLTGTEWAREGHMRVQADWEGPWVPDPRGLGITFQAAGTQEGGKSSI